MITKTPKSDTLRELSSTNKDPTTQLASCLKHKISRFRKQRDSLKTPNLPYVHSDIVFHKLAADTNSRLLDISSHPPTSPQSLPEPPQECPPSTNASRPSSPRRKSFTAVKVATVGSAVSSLGLPIAGIMRHRRRRDGTHAIAGLDRWTKRNSL